MVHTTNQAREDAEAKTKYGIRRVAPSIVLSPWAVGCGKSLLNNAIRDLENRHAEAPRVGVIETTHKIGGSVDPTCPFVWYVISGAGTLRQRCT